MMAIYGKNFCTSSKDAFFLLMRNVVRVAVLDKVTDFLLFLGKLLISGSVGILAFFFFSRKIPVFQEEVPSLNYIWVPLLTVIFGSYMIAHGFFNVYAMCVDTLFLCFCEDLERNDGSSSRPYYMSPGLHKILRKGEEGAKTCAASWVMHFTKLLALWLASPYLPCAWGSGRSRASTVGLNIETGCTPPSLSGMTCAWKDMLLLRVLAEKA